MWSARSKVRRNARLDFPHRKPVCAFKSKEPNVLTFSVLEHLGLSWFQISHELAFLVRDYEVHKHHVRFRSETGSLALEMNTSR